MIANGINTAIECHEAAEPVPRGFLCRLQAIPQITIARFRESRIYPLLFFGFDYTLAK